MSTNDIDIETTRQDAIARLKKLVAEANQVAGELANQGVRVGAGNRYFSHERVAHYFGFEFKMEQVRLLK